MMCIFHSKAWCMVIAKVSVDKNVKIHPEAVSILQLYYYAITVHRDSTVYGQFIHHILYLHLYHLTSDFHKWRQKVFKMFHFSLGVNCNAWALDMVPITLNPHITSLTISHSKIARLDDSFQFYEALVKLNMSNNIISHILDRSFVSQASIFQYCFEGKLSDPKLQSQLLYPPILLPLLGKSNEHKRFL